MFHYETEGDFNMGIITLVPVVLSKTIEQLETGNGLYLASVRRKLISVEVYRACTLDYKISMLGETTSWLFAQP